MLIRFTVGCGVDGWVWRINPSRATTHDGRASAEKYKVMWGDVCGTVCIDTWWENLPLLAHVGNTPSQFLPPQQNRKQRLGKSYLLWMQEMFPLKHEQVRQRSHYSASGLTWHVLAEVRLLVSRAGLPVNTFHRREDISLPLWNYLKRRGGRLERWLSGLLSSF